MKILVKKFYLAHDGQIYKAGEVVEIADAVLAKQLIARAGGDLEIYREQEALDMPDEEAARDEEPQNAADEVRGAADADADAGGAELPALDPLAVVQTTSKAKSKAK